MECKTNQDCPYDKTCINNNCVSPCLNELITCGRGAQCTAAAHRAECSCPLGTQGDPRIACIRAICHYNEDCAHDEACDRLNRVCRKVCSEDSCGDEAVCLAKNHEPMCSCPPGTKGNPYIECQGEGNSILCAQAHNEGYYATSDNARRRSKPRRSRGAISPANILSESRN